MHFVGFLCYFHYMQIIFETALSLWWKQNTSIYFTKQEHLTYNLQASEMLKGNETADQ